MIKKTASYGEYTINIAEDNKVSVLKNGVACDDATKVVLREIANLAGFIVESSWNTQQFGSKLVNFINDGATQTPKTVAQATMVVEEKTEKSTPAESFSSSAEDCASAKVRVYGKAQNRTALGIVHAYMVMYPHATLADLRKAFPNSLNTTSGQSDLFLDVTDSKTTSEWYFVGNDEIIKTGDNKKVALVMMWTKPAFEAIVAHARVYDIVVAKFEAVKAGVRGGFRLEYLNGYVPPKPEEKKSKWWLWLIVILLLAGIAAFFALRKPKEVVVEKVVYIERIAEIEKNFNAAQFEKGKAELSEDAKFVLHDLAKVLKAHENIKLSIEGHTSAEGDADFNQKLSEARAKAAVDFLVNREGISESRLAYEGFGSAKLKNTEDPNSIENRRIEFIIIE